MSVETITLTALMDYQDGEAFDGWLEIRLRTTSAADEAMVGPRVHQKLVFEDGQAQTELVPNSLLDEDSYYNVRIWKDSSSILTNGRVKLYDADVVVPARNCYLHELDPLEIVPQPTLVKVRDAMSRALGAAQESEQHAQDAQDAASVSIAAAAGFPTVVDSIDDITEESMDGFYYIKTDDIEE